MSECENGSMLDVRSHRLEQGSSFAVFFLVTQQTRTEVCALVPFAIVNRRSRTDAQSVGAYYGVKRHRLEQIKTTTIRVKSQSTSH